MFHMIGFGMFGVVSAYWLFVLAASSSRSCSDNYNPSLLWDLGAGHVYALVLMAALLSSQAAAAQSPITLPEGVTGVGFGKAQRYEDATGKETCAIVEALPDPPVFERGVTEVSYAVYLQPRAVKSASTQLTAPGQQGELQSTPCGAFTLIPGGFSQIQLGSTISRRDRQPLIPGTYTLRVIIDGQTADIPFVIGR